MDHRLLELFNRELGRARIDDLLVLLSTAALVVVPGLLAWLLWQPRHRRSALALLGALAVTLALAVLAGVLVHRPRPEGVREVLPALAGGSFPNLPAALAFCAATLLELSYRSWKVLVFGSAAALLTAASQLYLGRGYPSDLIGGAVVGASIGALFYGLWLQPQGPGVARRLRWFFWPQLGLVVIITLLAYLGQLPGGLLRWPCSDKVVHALLLGALAFWLDLWLFGRRVGRGRVRAPLALVIAFSCAALEELAQLWADTRSADLTDLASDLAGMLVFLWLSRRLARRGDLPGAAEGGEIDHGWTG
jgi:membrane-associated phospholipid phosphatase